MQYREFINEKGERLWLPIIAGAAILSAPFWINGNNKCCGGNNNYYSAPAPNQYQPYPVYQTNYYPVYTYPYILLFITPIIQMVIIQTFK